MKSTPSTRAEMYIRQAIPSTYRQVLKEIKQKEIYKLIVDTSSGNMAKFFRAVSSIRLSLRYWLRNKPFNEITFLAD
jgi:glutamate receptor, ionotropic, invertebrate